MRWGVRRPESAGCAWVARPSRCPARCVARWAERPSWLEPDRLWLLDPRGQPVLGYPADVDPYAVKEDLGRLLRMNPEAPWQGGQELAGR